MRNELLVKYYLQANFDFRTKEDWMTWPPNTFAVTSAILQKTGAYKLVISGDWDHVESREMRKWQQELEENSQAWKQFISMKMEDLMDIKPRHRKSSRPKNMKLLRDNIAIIVNSLNKDNMSFIQIRSMDIWKDKIREDPVFKFIRSLIIVHCISDEACTGLGLVGIKSGKTSVFNCLANFLLITTGTLTTFSKQLGIVLPKMRTPQSGLSIRSFSHHLTYHETEVEIMWRMYPWANIQENTLNILLVCWPNQISNSFFTSTAETFKPIRFFQYSVESANGPDVFRPSEIIRLMEGYRNKGTDRIHMLVFPEISLTENEWENLLSSLAIYYKELDTRKKQLPIVVAGIRRKAPNDSHEILTNELKISSYFARKWYTISQKKHHRWQLDANQIRQYELSGRFSTSRKWFEHIELSQRRLSIVTPNGWLSLCPLICEDLAQLEPVSSIIRGIGPTILIALLADGPQLKERWSARYASVFADDPGTSVLTVTSAGMVQKSVPRDQPKGDTKTLALWKDQITGAKTIEDSRKDKCAYCKNFMITVSSDWVEEFTADGRTDHQNASVIKFEGINYLEHEEVPPPDENLIKLESINEAWLVKKQAEANQDKTAEVKGKAKAATETNQEEEYDALKKKFLDRDWNDIREISTALSMVDSLIELSDSSYLKIVDILFDFENYQPLLSAKKGGYNRFYLELIELIYRGSVNPLSVGILVDNFDGSGDKKGMVKPSGKWPTLSYQTMFLHFKRIYREFSNKIHADPAAECYPYEEIFHLVKDELENGRPEVDIENVEKSLIEKYGPDILNDEELRKDNMIIRMKEVCLLMILFLLHNKLESNRKHHKSGSQIHSGINDKKKEKSFSRKLISELFDKIEKELLKMGY